MVGPAEATQESQGNTDALHQSGTGRTSILPLAVTPLERFLLQCDTRHSPMIMRVVLRFTGEYDLRALTETLHAAVVRHPLLSCRLGGRRGCWSWIPGTPSDVRVIPLAGSIWDSENGRLGKSIDLTSTAGLHTVIQVMGDGLKIILDAHHATTDGNGIRQLITDWLHIYYTRVSGLPVRLPLMDTGRLQQRHRFPLPPAVAPIGLKEAMRNFLATVKGRTARWQSSGRRKNVRETAHSYCVEQVLTNVQTDLIQERLTAWKVTLNDLVLASTMFVFSRMAPAGRPTDRVTVLNPVDLRMPSDRYLPATNRFGFAYMRRQRGDCSSAEQLLRGLHDEMQYVRSNHIGVEFIKGLETVSGIPGGVDFVRRMGLFIPSLQWTCLGDVTRGARRLMEWKDGALYTGGLKLESASAFAPFAENVPLSLASCEAGRQITLTVRSSPASLTMEETEQFAKGIVDQLCSLGLPDAIPAQSVSEEKQ